MKFRRKGTAEVQAFQWTGDLGAIDRWLTQIGIRKTIDWKISGTDILIPELTEPIPKGYWIVVFPDGTFSGWSPVAFFRKYEEAEAPPPWFVTEMLKAGSAQATESFKRGWRAALVEAARRFIATAIDPEKPFDERTRELITARLTEWVKEEPPGDPG